MIFTLLAALNGAAQQAFVVYEGVVSSHSVDEHPGSNYTWSVLVDFSPDTGANSGDYSFTSSNGLNEINVRWNTQGLYYLNVTETDLSGCTNRKIMAVNVVSNNRSIAFNSNVSSECYNEKGNGFGLPLRILDDGSVPLNAADFPVNVGFSVDGNAYTQSISYDQQLLNIDASWLTTNQQQESVISVQLTSAMDKQGVDIPLVSGNDVHIRTIHAVPMLQFVSVDSSISEYSVGTYEVEMIAGEPQNAIYHWSVDPPNGTSTDLSAITGPLAEISWGMLERYTLRISVTDGNSCSGDTITQLVTLNKSGSAPIPITAGPDTTIGVCEPYLLLGVYPVSTEYTYSWSPATGLNDPTIPNPIFTPGETTTYILTVTGEQGSNARDTVTVTVSEVLASAGDDVIMEDGTTVMLDASSSLGKGLSYYWTTENGTIDSGENTINPIVSSPGTYYLQVIDSFNCIASDSVQVSKLVYAPIANDIYDTTKFQMAVKIPVLDYVEDTEGDLDPKSLTIVQYPVNGSVYINYNDYAITYTPENGFLGGDVFEYKICGGSLLCDNAHVYVFVTAVDFLIPQAFTPNGDNINDFFEILGIEYYPNNSITVINRWGKKVYEAKAYGVDSNPRFWDGKTNVGGNNGDLPTGTYFYVLDLGNGEKPIAGSVYIDR